VGDGLKLILHLTRLFFAMRAKERFVISLHDVAEARISDGKLGAEENEGLAERCFRCGRLAVGKLRRAERGE
jgi:hypothetical protein